MKSRGGLCVRLKVQYVKSNGGMIVRLKFRVRKGYDVTMVV